MVSIKCKMCGGDLVLEAGQSVAKCEYCGSQQTVPAADSEKKLIQFERAERLRRNCEFDKAAGLYESIVADFRQEAEAYWGLVLCKYGIEYVDDPATGKKIPTCHRSGYESVMDDANLEMALEYADVVARRVYREEAKQIEELRKGIIAVSSREEPYDIFICYKETDLSGNRTLDSVLAQDIYDALTEKGYRVFFSRITLEDKLGQEYEPYIFAALNSAKIMLAVGTDYEYFNAVWVKNEWSRFLKLMTVDKSKHLIPCYKNIDAYDMPREFNKLQAQDLGKLGAIQDLLRGIHKLMPKEKQIPEQQNKTQEPKQYDKATTLLKRAAIALEDGDWDKSDKFYEEVLDLDPECARAYLGKALIEAKCTSLAELVDQRAQLRKDPGRDEDLLEYKPEGDPLAYLIREYAQTDLVKEEDIRKYYRDGLAHTQLVYTSDVRVRKTQKADEEKWWQEHKLLQRAEKYADDTLRTELKRERARLMTILDGYIQQEQEGEQWGLDFVKGNHRKLLEQVEEQVKQHLQQNQEMNEQCYQEWLTKAKDRQDAKTYRTLAYHFRTLGDYRDSRELAKHCEDRARDQEKLEQAEAARREEERREREKQMEAEAAALAKKKKQRLLIAVAALVILLAIPTLVIPAFKHRKGTSLMNKGLYREAFFCFDEACDSLLYYTITNVASDKLASECEYEEDIVQMLDNTKWQNGSMSIRFVSNGTELTYVSSNGTDTYQGTYRLRNVGSIGGLNVTGAGGVTIMLDDEDPIFLPGAYLDFSVQSDHSGYIYTLTSLDATTDDGSRNKIELMKIK